MARPASGSFAQRLQAYPWRRVGLLAAVALAISLALVLYLFGWADHFASRLLTAFTVSFGLLAVTFLGILPFIGWATTHWFGAGWAARPVGRATRPRAARPAAARSTST